MSGRAPGDAFGVGKNPESCEFLASRAKLCVGRVVHRVGWVGVRGVMPPFFDLSPSLFAQMPFAKGTHGKNNARKAGLKVASNKRAKVGRQSADDGSATDESGEGAHGDAGGNSHPMDETRDGLDAAAASRYAGVGVRAGPEERARGVERAARGGAFTSSGPLRRFSREWILCRGRC